MKNCPYCGKEISETAKKCRFCREWINKHEEISDNNDGTIFNKIQNIQNLKIIIRIIPFLILAGILIFLNYTNNKEVEDYAFESFEFLTTYNGDVACEYELPDEVTVCVDVDIETMKKGLLSSYLGLIDAAEKDNLKITKNINVMGIQLAINEYAFICEALEQKHNIKENILRHDFCSEIKDKAEVLNDLIKLNSYKLTKFSKNN